jgi:hypothetical protein
MPRGAYGSSNDFERTIIYTHGRIEKELEQIALATSTPFSLIAQRIAELLYPLGERRVESEMPLLRSLTPGQGTAVATVEMAVNTHDNETPRKRDSPYKTYWQKMTPDERRKEMERRILQRNVNLNAKKKETQQERNARKKRESRLRLKALRQAENQTGNKTKPILGRNGRPLRTKEEKEAKQKVYQARHTAKKTGLPVPDLPSENRLNT